MRNFAFNFYQIFVVVLFVWLNQYPKTIFSLKNILMIIFVKFRFLQIYIQINKKEIQLGNSQRANKFTGKYEVNIE